MSHTIDTAIGAVFPPYFKLHTLCAVQNDNVLSCNPNYFGYRRTDGIKIIVSVPRITEQKVVS
ncbi:hypothetical protein [Brenneria roseae]|uniref:hypothetical protein n=1 Tax=Brenneria roseae TaxID=1509241 RepID=UPI00109DBDAE|nr:hypothetical protein [Brenneria roseae]